MRKKSKPKGFTETRHIDRTGELWRADDGTLQLIVRSSYDGVTLAGGWVKHDVHPAWNDATCWSECADYPMEEWLNHVRII